MKYGITYGPYVAWFNYGPDGRITEAGVDGFGRAVNICVTTCENIEVESIEEFNAVVRADTKLLAASWDMLATLRQVSKELQNHAAACGIDPTTHGLWPLVESVNEAITKAT